MKSCNELINEMHAHIDQNDINGLINTIKNALQPNSQKNLLKQAITVLRIYPNKETIFHYSFRIQSKNLREILIDNKLLPQSFYDKKTSSAASPLFFAVEYGDYEFVESALVNGANPNEQNCLFSLLSNAAHKSNPKMVKLLINYKANINIEVSGRSPLFWAINRFSMDVAPTQQTEVIKLLIDNGAKVFKKEENKLVTELEASYPIFPDKLVAPETIALLEKEIHDRTVLNYTIPLLFWASKNDTNSHVYNVPEDMIKHIAAITRNQRI